MTLRPGITTPTLTVQSLSGIFQEASFNNEYIYRIGLEAQVILPFNKNKWGVIIEPAYLLYSSENLAISNSRGFPSRVVTIDYSHLEIPLGIRHYMFLNKKSKLFANFQVVFDVPFASKIQYGNSLEIDIRPQVNTDLGFGYMYNNKYSMEVRYGSAKNLTALNGVISSKYYSFSLILGYTLF